MKKHWKYHFTLALILILLILTESYFFNGIDGLKSFFSKKPFISKNIFFFSSTVIYILNYKFICSNFFVKNSVVNIILGIAILILIFSGIRFFLEEIIVFNLTGYHNYYMKNLTVVKYLGDNYYFAIKPILYSSIIFFVLNNKEKKEFTHQLELAKSKAELDLLKSQISPHFLFNTLNSFYVELIDTEPNTADDIQRLSELLRHVIYESKGDYILLQKEIKFLTDYIYFFKKRYEDHLFINFTVKGEISDKKIPSLILINFIENVFKHGIVDNKNEIAIINISVSNKILRLYTKNRKNESEKLMETGIGNENVKKRLDVLFFNQNYSLDFSNKNRYFECTLKMPL